MAIKDVIKVNRKTFFSPSAWVGYDSVKNATLYTWASAKTLFNTFFITKKPVHHETFEEAMHRLNLTEQDIQVSEKQYLILALIFAAAALLAGTFCIIFLIKASFASSLIAFGLTALLFALAFRNHFWYFQMKHRKLGCSFEEWRQGKPHNEENTHA